MKCPRFRAESRMLETREPKRRRVCGNDACGHRSYCGRSFEIPMPSYTRARELEQFIGHVIGNARRQQRDAFAAQMRGAIRNVEGEA